MAWLLPLIIGALTGANAALIGSSFLGALTFVAFVIACPAVTGLPGTGLVALAFVVVGNAASGGTVRRLTRQLRHALPLTRMPSATLATSGFD